MSAASQANPEGNSETVTLKLPSGEEVDALVPRGMSDEQIHGLMQQKHPEYFTQKSPSSNPESGGMSYRGMDFTPMVKDIRDTYTPENATKALPLAIGGGIQNIGEELPALGATASRLWNGVRGAIGLKASQPPAETPPSPAAQQLQSRIATERDLAAQPPFPNRAEGLPEVEAARPIATQHLQNAIATKPDAAPLPAVKPAKMGELLNKATGGKPLIPNVPLKNQMENVTPVVPRESAVVKSHSYDPQAQELTVKTQNGSEYVHGEVSPEQFKAFQNAESKGKAWNDIRNNSTLVAKIVNGKRVPVQPPMGARIADPNDLTPLLKESVQQAKAKK